MTEVRQPELKGELPVRRAESDASDLVSFEVTMPREKPDLHLFIGNAMMFDPFDWWWSGKRVSFRDEEKARRFARCILYYV